MLSLHLACAAALLIAPAQPAPDQPATPPAATSDDALAIALRIAGAIENGADRASLQAQIDAVAPEATRLAHLRIHALLGANRLEDASRLVDRLSPVLPAGALDDASRRIRAATLRKSAAEARARGDEADALQKLALASVLEDTPDDPTVHRRAEVPDVDMSMGERLDALERIVEDLRRAHALSLLDEPAARPGEPQDLTLLRREVAQLNARLDRVDWNLFDSAKAEPLARRLERRIDEQDRAIERIRHQPAARPVEPQDLTLLRREVAELNARFDRVDWNLFDSVKAEPLARRLERRIDEQDREIRRLRDELSRLRSDVSRLRSR